MSATDASALGTGRGTVPMTTPTASAAPAIGHGQGHQGEEGNTGFKIFFRHNM